MKFKFYGKEYDSEKIDFIHLRPIKRGIFTAYVFEVCQDGVAEIIPESEEIDELKVDEYYKVLKEHQESLGLIEVKPTFPGSFGGFANVNNAYTAFLRHTSILKRKYLSLSYKRRCSQGYNLVIFETKKFPKKSDKINKLLEGFYNKKDNKLIAEKQLSDYGLVRFLSAEFRKKEKFVIDSELLKKTLYYLRKDLADETEYVVSKSIEGDYNSIGIDEALSNLVGFGVLGKVIPSYNNDFYILLNEAESEMILKDLKPDQAEIIEKISNIYDIAMKGKLEKLGLNEKIPDLSDQIKEDEPGNE